jgi:uncharacterized membrane protein YsdA (DUF1294 family)
MQWGSFRTLNDPEGPFFHAEESGKMELLYIWCAINAAGSFIFYIDKQKAVKRKRRVSEKSLLTWAFLGAAPSMLVVSRLIRHKTRVLKFRIALPLMAGLQAVGIIYWMY